MCKPTIYTPTCGADLVPVMTAWLEGKRVERLGLITEGSWVVMAPYDWNDPSFAAWYAPKRPRKYRIVEEIIRYTLAFSDGNGGIRYGDTVFLDSASAYAAMFEAQRLSFSVYGYLCTTHLGDEISVKLFKL
jgi:hypothetical protein